MSKTYCFQGTSGLVEGVLFFWKPDAENHLFSMHFWPGGRCIVFGNPMLETYCSQGTSGLVEGVLFLQTRC